MDKKEFSSYLTKIYSQGLMMMGLGIGHDLGLIQFLCNTSVPQTAQQIAEQLHLKERYTREWLSAMTAANIVHVDRETMKYHLPESHKPDLRIRASFAPGLFAFCQRRDLVSNCFKESGPYGFEYEEAPSWFDWFDGYRSSMCEYTVDTEIIPLLRDQGVLKRLESGVKVIDVGSGTGSYTLALAKRFPKSTFTGLEYSNRGVTLSKKALEKSGLTNVDFVEGNALDLPASWTDSFDWVFVYDTLHDLPDPDKALVEIHRVMKTDGTLTIVEMGFSSNPADNVGDSMAAMYYVCSMFVCLPSSMSAPPHYGYGACWGVETLKNKLKDKQFSVVNESVFLSPGAKVFLLCSKTDR